MHSHMLIQSPNCFNKERVYYFQNSVKFTLFSRFLFRNTSASIFMFDAWPSILLLLDNKICNAGL